MAEIKRYMRVDEVADRFGVHVRTLKNWWLSGRTCLIAWHPDHRIGGKGLRFTTESVDEFERQGKVTPTNWEEPSECDTFVRGVLEAQLPVGR